MKTPINPFVITGYEGADFVTLEQGVYTVYDIFMAHWLQTKY